MRYLTAFGLVLLAVTAVAQPLPLPDPKGFLAEVHARLQPDAQRQYGYAYLETERRSTLDADGRTTGTSVTVIESHPGFPGEARWERILSRDGKPVPAAELQRLDDARRKQTEAYQRSLARQSAGDRARQEREWAKQRRELADSIDDIFRVYDIQMTGRETIGGTDTIMFSLMPRQGAKPVSDDGQWFRHFKGRAWISQSDYELVRLEVEAIDDVTIGLGVLVRVHSGTVASFERSKVDGERWLPVRMAYTMSARVLLLKQLRESVVYEYSNYRRAAE